MTPRARSPRTIGDYVVLRELGRGGMGAVYLAQDPVLDRKVAIKVIAGYRDHPSARARFLVEARAVARLSHPNVVAVFRAGEHDGEPYLVSEFIDGAPLDQLPRPLAAEALREIALGLARGLAAAHKEGILHRDVKPGNAIVGKDGTVKLLDFGLAKLDERSGVEPPTAAATATIADSPTVPGTPTADSRTVPGTPTAREGDPDATRTFAPPPDATPPAATDSGELTQAGSRMGTPRYMPPEAWRGERLTAASDVFSLGLVLWELVAGRHPLGAIDPEALPVASGRVPSLASAGVPVRPAVAAVIDRAVAADPAARPADAGALVTLLATAFDGPDVARDEDDAAAARAAERPSRAVAAMLIVAGGAAVAGVAWVARPRSSSTSAADAAVVIAAADAGTDAAAALRPRVLTASGGCASEPVYVDAATIAYTSITRDAVELETLVPGSAPVRHTHEPGWDWRPAAGRHRGEILYVVDGDDGRMRLRALARASGTSAEVMVAYYAVPVGDALFYVTDRDASGMYVRRGGVDTRLFDLPGMTDRFAVSRDGATLALLIAGRGGEPQLCLAEVATRAVRCLEQPVSTGTPVFSVDGRALYYSHEGALFAQPVAGGAPREVAKLDGSGGLAVSPDGGTLVASDCRSFGEIVAFGPKGAEVLVEGGDQRSPVAMPDGGLAFLRPAPDGTQVVVRRDGAPERVVIAGLGDIGRPAFSRDGARVAFRRPGQGIWEVPLAGGAPRSWETEGDARDPRWLDDGALIYQRDAGEASTLWVQAAPGAAPRALGAGWSLQDVVGGRALVHHEPNRLAWLDVATGVRRELPARGVRGKTVLSARALPDGALVVVVSEESGLQRLDPRTGALTMMHRAGEGQTFDFPTVLADGRVAVRVEIWLGELYALDGAW